VADLLVWVGFSSYWVKGIDGGYWARVIFDDI
jgi:hypothetical protein